MTSRTVIKFSPNLPLDVRLDYGPEGKLHEKTGNYQYTVNGNSGVMFLPDAARNQLLRTHAAKGDLVRICKSVAGRNTSWNVEVLSDAAEPQPAPAGRRIVAPARTNGANALAPKPAAVAPSPAAQSQQGNPMLRQMYQCLLDSFAVNMRAWEQCTKQTGIEMEAPNWEDIRTAANTLFIEINKRERGERY